MGNWRTVQVSGTIATDEAAVAIEMQRYSLRDLDPKKEPNCLSWSEPPGLVGLGQWILPNGEIQGHGNLFERDYSLEVVEGTLRQLAIRFPSLNMVLHAGGENEDPTCAATFWVRDRHVVRLDPQVAEVQETSEDEMLERLRQNLMRPHS